MARYPTARQVGKAFPVCILEGCEYAWPRGGTLESDLLLRDLTINALAMDTAAENPGRIVAHPLAFVDLQARVLRPASPTSMADDPIRVFRAARFAAELPEFSPSPELLAQMRACARQGQLAGHAAERVGGELKKALAAPAPGRFLEVLALADCLLPWFAELQAARGVPAGPAPFHSKDALGHTRQVMDRLAGDPLAVWMALVHDLGKTLTPPEEWPHHFGHEKAGAPLARQLGERLRLPRVFIDAGMAACADHMLPRHYPTLRPGTVVDLLMRLEAKRLTSKLFRLSAADTGQDHFPQARRDLRAILKVKLPPELLDKGEASGEALRQLRCEALVAGRKGSAS
jgi:tRNA nucleotidyltransferase (CCA-adding enzyme)